MAWTPLKTDYKDLIWEGLRKYKEVHNPDGTLSLEDVTQYVNANESFFGALDANAMNQAINEIMNDVRITDWIQLKNGCQQAITDTQNATLAMNQKTDLAMADMNTATTDAIQLMQSETGRATNHMTQATNEAVGNAETATANANTATQEAIAAADRCDRRLTINADGSLNLNFYEEGEVIV